MKSKEVEEKGRRTDEEGLYFSSPKVKNNSSQFGIAQSLLA